MIEIDGNDIADNKNGIVISDIEVDLSCGFEAGQAAFSLFDCYDLIESTFNYDAIKKYIILGSPVIVSLGYNEIVREVFRGLIVKVDFVIDDMQAPHVRVTAMDIKSIMMANHYHKRMVAGTYSAAIKEIFGQSVYMGLIGPTNVITKLAISSTPDESVLEAADTVGETDVTIEMVGESDYEFIVRAAKKFDYEFYCIGGQVIFREARCDTSTLISFPNTTKLMSLNVTYDVTGLVGKVTVRGLDAGKAKVVESSIKHNLKISSKSTAKSLIADSEYVYVDPTVTSKSDAQNRGWYLYDEMSYRFGTLDLTIVGLPEVIPGRFIEVTDFGTAVSNTFYVTEVHHTMNTDGEFATRIIGKAQKLATDLSSLTSLI